MLDAASVLKVVEVPRSVPNYWAEKGKNLIDEKYAELNGVGDVCSVLRISSAYFRDVFRAAFGESPKCYLTRMKTDRAKEILGESAKRVCEVAMMVGFKQRTVFEKAFKKFVGVAPSEYRHTIAASDFDTRK